MRLRPLLKKLALSAASLVVAGIVAELVARAMEPGPFSLVDRSPYVDSPADGHYRHRPGFTGRWDSTWCEIDQRGLRGPEREVTGEEGELRVACVGDSCTFGKGVLEPETWPRQLEALLRGRTPGAKVFNLGINGAHGRVYLEVLREQMDALAPQVVALGYNINDFPNSLRTADEEVFQERGLRRLLPQGLRDAMGRLALYRFARAAYYDMKVQDDLAAAEASARAAAAVPVDDAVWERERGYLTAIRDLAAGRGATVVVFLFPYESQVLLDDYDRGPIERLAGECAALGLPFFDLAEEFRAAARAEGAPRSLFIKGDRYHPNGAGYAVVARRVLAELEALGALPQR